MADQKTPERKLLQRARTIAASWNSEMRGYVALSIGLCLFLFSIGYFQFLHVAIGALGLALIIWGTFTSKVLDTLKSWFELVKKRFS